MAEESSSGSNQAKREKLTGFANWPIWSMITKLIFIEKDMWDLVSTGPRPERQNPTLWTKEVKEDRMAVGTACRIIIEGVNDQIAFNIMDLEDPKEMWDKLSKEWSIQSSKSSSTTPRSISQKGMTSQSCKSLRRYDTFANASA